jgi:hypothetical protein
MRQFIALCLFVVAVTSPFSASLVLVKISSFEYRIMGGTAEGMRDLKVDMKRPSVVAAGENFIVAANSFQTRLFTNDGTRLHDKKIGTGKTNWVKFGKNFALVKFRDGYFCYTVNKAGELIAIRISPSSYSNPNRIIILDSMVVHDWSSGGAFMTYLENGKLKSRKIHNYKLQKIWHREDSKTKQEKYAEQASMKMQSHDKLHKSELGTVFFPNPE